jgi:hypothetical protein
MNEKIYTIPVTNALREDSECAFCVMYGSLEASSLDFVMGPSYMERDVRDATDKLGFCREHIGKMLKSKNALGVALMLQTRLLRAAGGLEKAVKEAAGKKRKAGNLDGETCYICQKTKNTFNRYVDTFFYLYEREDDISELLKNGKGFCFQHFTALIERSAALPSKVRDEFIKQISKVQTENIKRLQDEIDWFTKKFDYRYDNEPWKDSKDSVPRLIKKLVSLDVE